MNDLHEERDLPDAVRDNARRRVLAEMNRPGRTVGWAPLAIAAVVVVLAAGAVTFTFGAEELPPVTGHSSPRDGWAAATEEMYAVQDRQAPVDQAARCVAAGAGGWQPLTTVASKGATVITYSTEAGPRFCELTPSTVTLSAPTAASAAGTAKATFISESGTVAGVLDPGFQIVRIGSIGAPDFPAVVRNGVFVSPTTSCAASKA